MKLIKSNFKYFIISFIELFCFMKSKEKNLRNLNQNYSSYLEKDDVSCNLINKCFSCNSPIYSCIYDNGLCATYNNGNSLSNFWYSKLNLCDDIDSINIIKNYCGKLVYDNSNNKILISDSKLYGNNTIENLFCTWEIPTDKKNIKIFFDAIDHNINLGLYNLNSEITSFKNLNKKYSEKIKLKNNEKIKIIYFHNKKPNLIPFKFEITIISPTQLSVIILYISIGIIFLLIVVLTFTLIIFIKKGLSHFILKNNIKKYEIEKLKSVKYKKELNLFNENCPICLEQIVINSDIIFLDCNHGFHVQCLMKWIQHDILNNRHCPICNKSFYNKERISTVSSVNSFNINNNNNN